MIVATIGVGVHLSFEINQVASSGGNLEDGMAIDVSTGSISRCS